MSKQTGKSGLRRRVSRVLIVCGALCVLCAAALAACNGVEERQAEKSVAAVLPALVREIHQNAAQAEEPDEAVVSVDGRDYLGYLSIPALGLSLPVQTQWSYPALRVTPCRYAGVPGDGLVIAAHNYARHFGYLSDLQAGDEVYFTDAAGTVWRYSVAEVETLAPTAVEEMTSSDWDLTLFTCTYGGRSRVTVRCTGV